MQQGSDFCVLGTELLAHHGQCVPIKLRRLGEAPQVFVDHGQIVLDRRDLGMVRPQVTTGPPQRVSLHYGGLCIATAGEEGVTERTGGAGPQADRFGSGGEPRENPERTPSIADRRAMALFIRGERSAQHEPACVVGVLHAGAFLAGDGVRRHEGRDAFAQHAPRRVDEHSAAPPYAPSTWNQTPSSAATSSRICWAMGTMSATRSRSGGTVMRITLRR